MSGKQVHERIRGRKGVKYRKAVRDSEPLCRKCAERGRVTVATEIDHIVPLSEGGSNDRSNLQPLCKACHAAKTTRRPKHGVDVNGYPLDPDHPWNARRAR